jgi:hypothetical protein
VPEPGRKPRRVHLRDPDLDHLRRPEGRPPPPLGGIPEAQHPAPAVRARHLVQLPPQPAKLVALHPDPGLRQPLAQHRRVPPKPQPRSRRGVGGEIPKPQDREGHGCKQQDQGDRSTSHGGYLENGAVKQSRPKGFPGQSRIQGERSRKRRAESKPQPGSGGWKRGSGEEARSLLQTSAKVEANLATIVPDLTAILWLTLHVSRTIT